MSAKTNDLFTMIENMPIDVKTALLEKILASIHPLQKDVDKEWIEEAEKRINQIKKGNVQAGLKCFDSFTFKKEGGKR